MKHSFKLIGILILSAASITLSQTSDSINKVNQPFQAQADSIAPDHSGMSELTSAEFTKNMIPGWNIGNSLEAISNHIRGNETVWGNPKITQKLIDSIKTAGFKSICME